MFENCGDSSDVKREFKRMSFKVHPDVHPNGEFAKWNEQMRLLIEEYHAALKRFDGQVFVGSDSKEHTYKYSYSTESDIVNIIDALIKAHIKVTATVNIVGIYVYVEGLTRNDREDHAKLKACGLRFNAEHAAWYWKPAWYRPHHSGRTLTEIKYVYGERTVDTDESHGIA